MLRSFFGLLALTSCLTISIAPTRAADYAVRLRQPHYAAPVVQIDRGPNPYCGPRCGCPTEVRVRHRSLVQYYPSGFDPRTREAPYYAYGPNRTYVRYVNPRDPDRVLHY